jgi:two-component system chemotaxis response regulator CheB
MTSQRFSAIVIGASAGGMAAIGQILTRLPHGFDVPILIVQHLHPTGNTFFAEHLDALTPESVSVTEAHDKQPIEPGLICVAPANYHLLVEADETLALSVDPKVNHSRPSIDVLFDSAARVFGQRLLGIVLTGANSDGAAGAQVIKRLGGIVVVQDPESAEQKTMPRAAIDAAQIDRVLTIGDIADWVALQQAAPKPKGDLQ